MRKALLSAGLLALVVLGVGLYLVRRGELGIDRAMEAISE